MPRAQYICQLFVFLLLNIGLSASASISTEALLQWVYSSLALFWSWSLFFKVKFAKTYFWYILMHVDISMCFIWQTGLKPGRIERLSSSQKEGCVHPPRPLSNNEIEKLEEECYHKFIKIQASYITRSDVIAFLIIW